MPRTARLDGLDALLAEQLCVVSRGQLLTLGMTDNAMQYRVRSDGPWQTLLPGVYLSVSGTPSPLQKQMGALLYAGPGSLITGAAALMHYNIRTRLDLDIIDVIVPIERQRRSDDFARLHRTTRMPRYSTSVGPLRLAPVPRALADTARQLTCLGDVRAVVAGAVQQGRCTISELAGELGSGPVKHSAMFRTVLAEVADGIRSAAELHDLIRAARLPMPLFNPSLYDGDTFIAKPDAWWPDAGVAAEADSREWHLSPADWDRTRRRHDLMAAAGIILLHFSPRQIRREPQTVAQMLRDALIRGLNRPPLPIRTVPSSVPSQ